MQSFNKNAHSFLSFLYRLLPDFTLMSPWKKVPEAIPLVMSMFAFFMHLSYQLSVFLNGLFPIAAVLLTPDVSAVSEHLYYLSSLLSFFPFSSQSGILVPNHPKSVDM